MQCPTCQKEAKKHGKDRKGNQRFKCHFCIITFTEPRNKPLDNMRLDFNKALLVLNLLAEGNSIRSTERITQVHRDTILNLLVLVGQKCERFLENRIQNIKVKDVQADEIWTFVSMKEKTLKAKSEDYKNRFGWEAIDKMGDAYTFVGFERNTKLVLCWHLGRRTSEDTLKFSRKLNAATADKSFQITTDGFAQYRWHIVHELAHKEIDFAQLIKVYATPQGEEHRYSPPQVVDCIRQPVFGNPDERRVCTSHVERQNLSIRTFLRRFVRLTLGFSKKWENLKAALAFFFRLV